MVILGSCGLGSLGLRLGFGAYSKYGLTFCKAFVSPPSHPSQVHQGLRVQQGQFGVRNKIKGNLICGPTRKDTASWDRSRAYMVGIGNPKLDFPIYFLNFSRLRAFSLCVSGFRGSWRRVLRAKRKRFRCSATPKT